VEDPPYLVPHTQEAIRVLYADPELLVVRKPDLLLSVPGRHPRNRDCLISRLQEDWPGARIVHRLDLDTSGVMIVALTAGSQSVLGRLFQERRVCKEYEAVVYGRMQADEGEINLPIARDWERRPRQKICHESGKSASTFYRVLQRSGDRTRVRLEPVTGRSHQLRIHLASLGHPILGCDMYAHAEALSMAPRLLLHATRIAFPHPQSEEWLDVSDAAPF
jgi:tRNA pseudouridine32 synthase/23S rRNA pseudouridine746 synthase